MQPFIWNAERRRWCGHEEIDGRRLEVAVDCGHAEPEPVLDAARRLLARLSPRVDAARGYAAAELLPYYNHFNAHLKEGEQLDEAEFAGRMELEGINFLVDGSALLQFRHALYRGFCPFEGGLVCVRADTHGGFVHASWMSGPDADTAREARRCCEPYPWPDEYEG